MSERLAECKKTILSLHSNEMTLEQIFLRLTDAADKGTLLLGKSENKEDKESVKVKVVLDTGEATVGEETEPEKEDK